MEPIKIQQVEAQVEEQVENLAATAEEASQLEETLIHDDPTISEQTAE